MDKEEANHDHWVWKRRFMFVTTGFFMIVILVILFRNIDNSPSQTAMWMSFLGIVANVGAYVFGASWEDILMARAGFTRSNSNFLGNEPPAPVPVPAPEDEHHVR